MGVWRRPLLLVFLGLAVFIVVRFYFTEDRPGELRERKSAVCVGTVDDIQIGKSGRALILSEVRIADTATHETFFCDKILLYDSSKQDLLANPRQGNIIEVTGSFSGFERAGNPGQFDELTYYRSRHIEGRMFADTLVVRDERYRHFQYALFRFRQAAVDRLTAAMNEDDAGILAAMIFGDKSCLPEEEKELYQQTGIGHMLVVSGLHISLLSGFLFWFLRSYVMPMRGAAVITVLFLLAYGQLVGFPVAATRAVLMMCCRLLARYTGKTYDALSALSLGGIFTLVQEPTQLFQCGFLLSYGTIFGILLLEPVLEKADIQNGLLGAFCSSSLVFLVTLPVMLWFYYEICPYSVLANMVVLPFLSLLVGVGIVGCLLSFVWMPPGEFVLATAHYILKLYEMVCRLIRELPFSNVVTGRPPLGAVILYYGILLVALYLYLKGNERGRSRSLVLGAAGLFACLCFFRPSFSFLYTQLDVGQGDCACIFYGDRTILIDGGSSSEKEVGKYRIRNFLKYYGRSSVDVVFISHSDADHVNGIEELAQNQENWGIRIGRIVLPQLTNPDGEYVRLVRSLQKSGSSVTQMRRGQRLALGEVICTCLHPSPDYQWKSENDYSLTLAISYQGLRILTVGDLEESGEKEILGSIGAAYRGYQVLKVGHHGSKTSSSEDFLSMAAPGHALISAGKNNRYGHPAKETLGRLTSVGAKIYSTIDSGAVMVMLGENGYRIKKFKDDT